ncbi:MAG: rhodanese-like domain-containing protein [Parcubacteria group bacterium]|jgi:rhodanese-related sulfurtransferase
MVNSIDKRQFKELINKEFQNLEIVDVREEGEFKIVRIKNSKLIPMGEIMNNLNNINWNKKVILVCRSGSRSGYVAQLLDDIGKEVINMEGGIYSLEIDSCDCLEN